MDERARRLMDAIDAFPVGGTDHQAFMGRLTRQEGWSFTYAACAVAEYKRFLVLKVLFDGQVSPSRSVDKVWHLHLLYTQDYWQHLCRDTIGRELHHAPTTAPPADLAALEARYRATLDLYRDTFGEAAPQAIWEDWAAHQARRPMPKLFRRGVYAVVFVASFLAFYLLARHLPPPKDYASLIFAICAFVAIGGRRLVLGYAWNARTGPVGDVSGLSIYDLARLFKGPQHAAFTAAISLVAHGYARVEPPKLIARVAPVPVDASPWERVADAALAEGPCTLEDLDRALAPLATASAVRAAAIGLERVDEPLDRWGTWSFLVVAAAIPAVALAWPDANPESRLFSVMTAWFILGATMGPSRLANVRRLMVSLGDRFAPVMARKGEMPPPGDLVISVALHGGTTLKGTPLWDLTKAFNQDRINAESCG